MKIRTIISIAFDVEDKMSETRNTESKMAGCSLPLASSFYASFILNEVAIAVASQHLHLQETPDRLCAASYPVLPEFE